MLQIQNLTITHLKDLTVLVDNLSFTLPAGEKLAIIGEEGTGKSTLIRAILDKQRVADYARVQGGIVNRFSSVGYLPQAMSPHELSMTISDYLYRDLDYEQFDFNLFYKLAANFHFPVKRLDKGHQLVTTLSGGEKLKLQLLKILSVDPDLLLLDEPSSDLDLQTVRWLQDFIHKTDKTVIFISHDEQLLAHTASSILHLELVKKRQKARTTFYRGIYETYKTERRDRFERQLQVANKEREAHAEKVARNERVRQSVEHALRHTKNDQEGRLLAKKMHVVLAQGRRYEKEKEQFTEIPQDMDDIQLFFSAIEPLASSKLVLHLENQELPTGQSISLIIRGQEKIVITGRNGIGKTRLLQTILAELQTQPDLSVGYLPQDYESALPADLTPIAFLSEVASVEQARTLLASLQFTRQEVTHALRDLSSGQKAKCFLARMVLAGNQILLLDEPTRHFSPTSQPIIRQLLQDFPGCIVSVSHDRSYIEQVCPLRYELTAQELKLM